MWGLNYSPSQSGLKVLLFLSTIFLPSAYAMSKKRSPSSEFMYNEVWPKVKNTNSKHSRKRSHEELKAGSWTHVRNKDPGMLVK